MNEIPEVTAFLRKLPAFEALEAGQLDTAARAIRIAYCRRGSEVLPLAANNDALHIVRSGAVEIRDAAEQLVARLAAGECFGFPSLMNAAPTRHSARAIEDTLVFRLDAATFSQLRRDCDGFDTFFVRALSDRLLASPRPRTGDAAAGGAVRDLIGRPLVSMDESATIRDVTRHMTEAGVSAMVIMRDGAMRGIVTDRDIRSRVVAAGRPPADPVTSVMTEAPVSIDADAPAHEAALRMAAHGIHHLPVIDNGTPLGMVSRSDFMRFETGHPLYLLADLRRQTDAAGLARVCERLPGVIGGQVESDISAQHLGRFITAVTDGITRQLISIAERDLGPPPCAYAWIALGSQARQEQSALSDQDNAMILADDCGDDSWFEAAAKIVNDGLNDCGYAYCPGDVMASNARWRQPLAVWQRYFNHWITVPEEKALMHASIFFDLRGIAGDLSLVERLKAGIIDTSRNNEIFLAMMARTATQFQPPLGFFRQFVLERSGEHRDALDIKRHGIMPIVELARVRALAGGQLGPATRGRLNAAAQAGELNARDAGSLIDALDFIEGIRLEHQHRRIGRGEAPDNFVAPSDLSPLVRQNLKAAFRQIRTSQAALLNRFHLA
jgi:CBS domain-containing protein